MSFKTPSKRQKRSPKLPLHEWYIVILFCLIFLALAGFALRGPKKHMPHSTLLPASQEIALLEINIEGEVAKPGTYHLPLQTSLKELLAQAEPLPSADLSQLNGRRKLRNQQTIQVPARRMITIHISGAVKQPGSLEILSGTRYCELIDQLSLLPHADLKVMHRRRRFIREGECIEVPVKKEKKIK